MQIACRTAATLRFILKKNRIFFITPIIQLNLSHNPHFKRGVIFTPLGHNTGTARGGISNTIITVCPPLWCLLLYSHILTYHFLPVPEYIFELFLHLHFRQLLHNTLGPKMSITIFRSKLWMSVKHH